MTHVGAAYASTTCAAIGSGSLSQMTILTGPLISTDGSGGTAAASGVNPCVAQRWFPADTALSTFEYRMRGQTAAGSPSVRPARQFFLADAYSAGYPAAANVRSATTYGPGSIYTGTCAVPPAESVALGVPVDATTGTAAITAASIRSAVGLASANLDSQLDALPTAAEAASAVRSELTTELARLDAAISTRLAASGYTTPPTAAAIATAVNSALDRTGYSLTSAERSAIATAVEQSILNESDGQAILNAIVGAIGNQNIDQVALVAAIRADLERTGGTLATRSTLTAAQVRTELAPELGRVDATISSRLAPGGTLARVTLADTVTTLTNAPDVPTEGEIADAVRTELTPELARLSNAATTQEVGDIVEGALGD